jgi:hypothetical protein
LKFLLSISISIHHKVLHLTINPTDKDSKKNALAEIDKFVEKKEAK